MKVYETSGKLVKAWVDGVPFEDSARKQVENAAAMPFIHKHVAVMPDVHAGIGATVGSVIPTVGAIIPAAVGVDIGCGMQAVRTTLVASQLPDNLHELRGAIERAVPHGRTDRGGRNDRGAWGEPPAAVISEWSALLPRYAEIIAAHPGAVHQYGAEQLGTLGTGNHFIEVCLDEKQRVWMVLHSGSRGIGNRIGTYFIERAKREMERWFIHLPDADLAYLAEGDLFDSYIEAVGWAQDYAKANRRLMMAAVMRAASTLLPVFRADELVVDCHHNYVERENHYGKNVWLTRKGAVRARLGDLGIIPGSMGARSFIVRGKGNPESFHSCSHGAGRAMSRTAARQLFTVADHEAATAGVECRKDADVVDETPGAYKNIDAVMEAQRDLVDVVHILRQVVCVKG